MTKLTDPEILAHVYAQCECQLGGECRLTRLVLWKEVWGPDRRVRLYNRLIHDATGNVALQKRWRKDKAWKSMNILTPKFAASLILRAAQERLDDGGVEVRNIYGDFYIG